MDKHPIAIVRIKQLSLTIGTLNIQGMEDTYEFPAAYKFHKTQIGPHVLLK
jgi:hypothetical protein